MKFIYTFLFFISLFSSVTAQDVAENKILIPYRNGKKWGYSDTLGRILIKPQFDSVGFFTRTDNSEPPPPVAIVVKKGKQGLISTNGILVIPVLFDFVNLKNYELNDLIFLGSEGKSGAYSGSKEIIPIHFDRIYLLNEKIVVKLSGKFGLYSSEGREILPPDYDSIYASIRVKSYPSRVTEYDFWATLGTQTFLVKKYGGLTEVAEKEKSSTISGGHGPGGAFGRGSVSPKKEYPQKVFPAYQESKLIIHNNQYQYLVKKDALWGVIDEKENEFIPVVYDSIYLMDPFFLVKKNQHWGIINDFNTVILPIKYDQLEPLGNRYLRTFKGNLKGFMLFDTYYPPIPPLYEDIEKFKSIFVHKKWSFTIFKVVEKGRTGYVGENGVEYFKD